MNTKMKSIYVEKLKEGGTKCVQFFCNEISKMYVGRAHPSLVSGVVVDVNGKQQRLNSVAAIDIADRRSLLVRPWDVTLLGSIDKALKTGSVKFSSQIDGNVVKITLSEITTEGRKELCITVRDLAAQAKTGVRNARRSARDALSKDCDSGQVSREDRKRIEKDIDSLTVSLEKEIDSARLSKERDIIG